MKLIDYSDVEIRSLWNDYAYTRNKGLKNIANNKLKNLIEKGNIEDFQHPLVENLILPVIAPMVENDQMPYLRWSYELNRACYNSEEILLKANKVDPSDIVKKYEDINYYRDLYDSWFAYKNENSDFTFEQWCERNNKKFSWISAYYYE